MEELDDNDLRKRLIGRVLKAARVEAGLTQSDVSNALSYSSPQFVSNWERGLSLPPLLILPKLAELYGLSARHIIDTFDRYQEAVVEKRRRAMTRLFRQKKRG